MNRRLKVEKLGGLVPEAWAALALVLVCCGVLFPAGAHAQVRTDGAVAHSRSDQFVIRFNFAKTSTLNVTNRGYVRLEPSLLTISCERIKTVLLRELGATDAWQGKVFVSLYPARVRDDSIVLTPHRFSDGWRYNLELPDVVERGDYVRAIVQVLLLEIANRGAIERSAEVPAWLVEGMAEELIASDELGIILTTPKGVVNGMPVSWTMVEAIRENPLQKARNGLSGRPPLSFDQLSWPEANQFLGDAATVYRGSAQVLVHQLITSEKGRDRMRDFLARLPQHYNWQFAFLKAFHFARPLDVEKWWALQVTLFMGRDPMLLWTADESWEKLSAGLHSSVQIRTSTNDLPVASSVTLQTIIREWDAGMQFQTLPGKSRELDALRLRLNQDFISLADAYRQVLDAYLKERMRLNFSKPNKITGAMRRLSEDAARQLDLLDIRLQAMRPAAKPKSDTALNAGR